MQNNSDEIAESYNKFGKMYHETRTKSGRLFNEFLEMPATLSLIPNDLTHCTVLDAGCGSGIYTRELAKRGASVIGIDISSTMINIAREETETGANIHYRVGNIDEMDMQDNSVDLIICNYVLENLDEIANVFSEFFRVLKKDGHCIYSISHPIRAMAKREQVSGHEIWQLENYYDKGIRISDFGQSMKIKKYKRTIADYINSSIAAGFIIKKFCEPQPIPSGEKVDTDAYNTAMRLPQLLLIQMIK